MDKKEKIALAVILGATLLFIAIKIYMQEPAFNNAGIYDEIWTTNTFADDSARIYAFRQDSVYDGSEMTFILDAIGQKRYNDKQQTLLFERLNNIKVKADTGVVFVDAFDNLTQLSSKTKEIVTTFEDYVKNNYEIKYIPKGFKNNFNKKVFKLKEKYGWSDEDCITVANREIRIGMSRSMVAEAWGRPIDINKTTGASYVHEQWVYGNSYVYFDDGILTTIQD